MIKLLDKNHLEEVNGKIYLFVDEKVKYDVNGLKK